MPMELMTATVDSEVEKCLHSAYGHLSWWRLQRFLSSELFADSRQTDPAGFPRPRKPLEAPSAFIVAARLRVRAYFAVVVAHGAASWAAQFQLVLDARVQPGCELSIALAELVSFRSKLGQHFVVVHYLVG
jgi:hypothetical protein